MRLRVRWRTLASPIAHPTSRCKNATTFPSIPIDRSFLISPFLRRFDKSRDRLFIYEAYRCFLGINLLYGCLYSWKFVEIVINIYARGECGKRWILILRIMKWSFHFLSERIILVGEDYYNFFVIDRKRDLILKEKKRKKCNRTPGWNEFLQLLLFFETLPFKCFSIGNWLSRCIQILDRIIRKFHFLQSLCIIPLQLTSEE